MLAVVPLTGTPGEGALYPSLLPGSSGLRQPSWALIDQPRAVDKRRVIKIFGIVLPEELGERWKYDKVLDSDWRHQ